MIRNVFDNHKRENPYTIRESNLRMGRFFENKLSGSQNHKRSGIVSTLSGMFGAIANKFKG